eukprot:99208_1
MEISSRLRIFYVTLVVGIWLLIVDAINPLANFDTSNLESQEWTFYFLVVNGLIMGIIGGICSLFILMWACTRCAGLTLWISVFIAAILRIIAVTVGFENLKGSGSFNTTSAIVTAAAIFLLQIFIVFEGCYVARQAAREREVNH